MAERSRALRGTMQATIRSYLGTENFIERFDVRLGDGRFAELRWADCDRSILADATARILDASAFVTAHPHPVAPEVLGTTSTKDGVGIVVGRFSGPTLAALCVDPIELEVALEISGRLVDYLIHLATLRDSVHRPFEVALRNLSLDTVRLSAAADVRVTGVETLGGDWPGRVVRTTHMERSRDTRLAVLGKGPADDIYDLGRIILALIAGRATVEALDHAVNRAEDGTLHDKAVYDSLSPRNLQVPYSLLALLQRMLSFYPDERPEPHEVRASVFELFASPVALEAYAREVCGGYRYLPVGRHPMIGQVFELATGVDALPGRMGALVEAIPTEEVPLPRAPSYQGVETQPQRANVRSEARPKPGQPAFQRPRDPRPTLAESTSMTAQKIAKRRVETDEPETVLGILRSRNAADEPEVSVELPAPTSTAYMPLPVPPRAATMPQVVHVPVSVEAKWSQPTWVLMLAPLAGAVGGVVLGLVAIAIGGLFVLLLILAL